MFEIIVDLLVLIPVSVILAFLLSMAGYLLLGTWGGLAGFVVGFVLGLYVQSWVGSRVDAAMLLRRLTGTMLLVAAVFAVVIVAISTR